MAKERLRTWFFEIGTSSTKLYLSGIHKGKSKMFVNDGIPDKQTFEDLLASVYFKNTPEDKATTIKSGVVRRATDAEVFIRDTTNGVDEFPNVITPHQIPIYVIGDPDGTVNVDFKQPDLTEVTTEQTLKGLTLKTKQSSSSNGITTIYGLELAPGEGIILDPISGLIKVNTEQKTITYVQSLTQDPVTKDIAFETSTIIINSVVIT